MILILTFRAIFFREAIDEMISVQFNEWYNSWYIADQQWTIVVAHRAHIVNGVLF